MSNLKSKLVNNETTYGSWITIGDMAIAEIMAKSGFDWLTIDMEHSCITFEKAQQLITVIELCGISPLVRVGVNDETIIKRVMDSGAHGVIVPMVNSVEDAKRAVNAVKYPPIGKRGVGLARAQKFGFGFDEYKQWNETDSIVIAQIEHIDGVNHLEEILAVDGIDGFIIGPYDLSASLGVPGDFDDENVKKALKQVEMVSATSKKIKGFHIVHPSELEIAQKLEDGYRFLALGLDSLILGNGCRKILGMTKEK